MSESGKCNVSMYDFWAHPAVQTACGRPAGHTGDHWPMPLAGDRAEEGQ